MKQNKRFMAPGFLNRIDAWLLVNKPETWSARTHLVLFYGVVFIIFLALLTHVFPDDPRTPSGVANWALFTTMITIIGLVVWIIYLLRFNVFKRYGITSGFRRLKTFLLYFFAAGIIITIPFVQGMVESYKANAAYSDEELVNDVNNMNTKIVQLEFDSLNHRWSRDTLIVSNDLPTPPLPPVETADNITTVTTVSTDIDYPNRTRPLIDSASFIRRLKQADSSEQVNDSTWVLLTAPPYTFASVQRLDNFSNVHQLNSKDIYYKVVKDFKRPDATKTSAELLAIVEKYRLEDNVSRYAYEYHYRENITRKYFMNSVNESLWHLSIRKSRWRGHNLTENINLFFYLTLTVSLLVFIFRHSTVKAFFLAMLASCVLTIFSALILAFIGYQGASILSIILFYFLLFTVISAYTFFSKTRHIVTGVAINIFTVMFPFVPLVLVGLYDAVEKQRFMYRGFDYDNDYLDNWYLIAQWAGPLIFLILAGTYIHRLYRRWFSLPEE